MAEFNIVEQEISRRFSELRIFWTEIKRLAAQPPSPQPYSYLAGTGFTILFAYAVLEFSLTRSVRQLSQLITDYSVRAVDVTAPMMCLVHDPKLTAAGAAGKKTRLEKRLDLFAGVTSHERAIVHDNLLVPELQNVWSNSLQDIFRVFGIVCPHISDPINATYIDRIVNDRNAVAHGREAPDVVGSRYTGNDVETSISRLEQECRYIVNTFDSFFVGREFISSSARSRYLRRDNRA